MQTTVSNLVRSSTHTQISIEPQAVSRSIASSNTNTNTNNGPIQTAVSNFARSSQASSERLPDSQILSNTQTASTSAVGPGGIQTGIRSRSDLSSSPKSTTNRIISMSPKGSADIQVSSSPQSAPAFAAGLTDSQTTIGSHRSFTSSFLQPPMPQSQGASSSTITKVWQSTLISGSPINSKSSTVSSGNLDDSIGTLGAPAMTAMVHPSQNNGDRSSSIPWSPNIDSVTRSAAATNISSANISSTALLSSNSSTSQAFRYSNSTMSLKSGASSISATSRAFSDSKTNLDSSTPSSGADSSTAAYSASSATHDGHSTTSGSTTTSSLPSDAAASRPEQAGGPARIFLSPVSSKSRRFSTHLSVGGNSTLSTSIVPANASDPLSQADVSSVDKSSERPIQDTEPNIRLATSTSGSLLTAGDDKQTYGNPGAKPAATRAQARSTTGVFNGELIYRPHQKPPEYDHVAQSTPFRYQHGSASGERSTVSVTQSVLQSEGQPGEDSVNGPSSSPSESLSGRSAVVTTTDAQGSQVVHTVPAAVIRVPVGTTNIKGISITTESLLTAAATASLDVIFTSIICPGSTALQTSQIPAVVYTTTNSQGSEAVISSAVVPSNVAGAAGQGYASPENDQPESPLDTFSDNQNPAAAGSPQSVHSSGETPIDYPAAQNPAKPQSGSQGEGTSESQDSSEGRPQLNAGEAGESDQSNPAAENTASANSGDLRGAVSSIEPVPSPKGRPNSNAGEGEQVGQPDSAQNSNGVGRQDHQQNPSEPESDSSSTTTASSQASGYSFPAPSMYNASNLKLGNEYGRLASSGLLAPAENGSTRFVQRRMTISRILSEYSPNTLLYYD